MATVTSRLKAGSIPSDEQLMESKPVNPELHANPRLFKPKKKQITLKIDADVLEAYRGTGKGYQTRINEALRHAAVAAGLLS